MRSALVGGLPSSSRSRATPVEDPRRTSRRSPRPRLEGRLAGSTGERLAGDYIVAELQRIGAQPLPGQQRLPAAVRVHRRHADGGSIASRSAAAAQRLERQGCRRAGACRSPTTATSTAPVVFAGYGIVVPESQDFGYDSYATLDVKDKVVLVLRYFPEDADQKTRGHPRALRRPALQGDGGAAARREGDAGRHRPALAERRRDDSDDLRHGARRLGHRRREHQRRRSPSAHLRACAGQDARGRRRRRSTPATRTPPASRFQTSRVTVHAAVDARDSAPATTSSPTCRRRAGRRRAPKPWVALGAHYDHLGHGEAGNSLAGKDDAGKIHFGADDNASGSAAVLAVGDERWRRSRARRNVLRRLLVRRGARPARLERVRHAPPVPLDQLAAYLNFDMVGRMQDNKLTVQATGTSPAWGRIIEQANVAAGFDLAVQQDPYQPTDVASFNLAGVPCLNFFTGTHADYHKPSDTADKIDYEDLDRIVDFAAAIVARGRGSRPRRRVHQGRSADCRPAAAAPACASSPARFPTTRPR